MPRNQNFKCNCGQDTCKWTCFILWLSLGIIFIFAAELTQSKYCTDGNEHTRIVAFPIGSAFAFLLVGPFLCTNCGIPSLCKAIFLLIFLATAGTCTVFSVLSVIKSCHKEELLLALFSIGWVCSFIGGCVFGRIVANMVGYVRM